MGIRTLHQGVQTVASREEDDDYLLSSQQKERFLKN
jgi:hypothetical protein